ncbi:FAD-dependent monooxygenase [Streptomyces sp. NPDC088400]|uniref:FAD-dependent monooxygenase n=1 Tax=Streptomyces sp. NPDC088400 TaxID=3365861 RepID=UPI0037F7582F
MRQTAEAGRGCAPRAVGAASVARSTLVQRPRVTVRFLCSEQENFKMRIDEMGVIEKDVVIVGAGAVGLSLAMQLGRLGVSCLAVDRREATSDHPRARGVNTRTAELMRQWGMENVIRHNALPSEDFSFAYRRGTLLGYEYGRTVTDDGADVPSPMPRLLVPQDIIEDELRLRARESAEVRLQTEVVDFEENATGVRTTMRDLRTGEIHQTRSRYLIGADGAMSMVRQRLGIEIEGNPLLGYWLGMYWKSTDPRLWEAYRERPGIGIYAIDRDDVVVFSVVDRTDRWLTFKVLPPPTTRPAVPSDEEAIGIIRKAVGYSDLDLNLVNAAVWRVSSQVARSYRQGRVFLAGDAAHLLPHTGGLGMNTGIQDAHNLAWKLGLVLRGYADPSLLDTYEVERRPVAKQNADWSSGNNDTLKRIISSALAEDQPAVTKAIDEENAHIRQEGAELGFAYASRAIVGDGSIPPAPSQTVYTPTAVPGCRAPHVWLDDHGVRMSSIDLLHSRFVVLAGPQGRAWVDAATAMADRTDVPVIGRTIGRDGDLTDTDGDFLETYGISAGGAVLVRPDGHVAWRASAIDGTDTAPLAEALEQVLGRPVRPSASASHGSIAA